MKLQSKKLKKRDLDQKAEKKRISKEIKELKASIKASGEEAEEPEVKENKAKAN